MTVAPDLKQQGRHKDPELMAELGELWAETGCSLCSREATPDAEMGGRVQLHHVIPRSRGGGDYAWNILGLGGPFLCGHHDDVTENRIRIERNEAGFLVWRDMRAGGTLAQACRFIAKYSQVPPAGASADTPERVDPLPVEAERDTTPIVEDPPQVPHTSSLALEPAGDDVSSPRPDDPPEVRASQIRNRLNASRRLMMESAVLLNDAYERQHHVLLGVTWTDYYSSFGLERSNVSKMLLAAQTLGDQWQQLQPAAREHVSMEQLYQASLLVTQADWAPDAAMDAAVSTPSAHLVALRKGDEPSSRCMCECAKCGAEVWHARGPA